MAVDAISPTTPSSCSSIDVYDSLIASLRDTTKYPNLQRTIIVAHSGGASMIARYGMLSTNTDIKYVIGELARDALLHHCSTGRTWQLQVLHRLGTMAGARRCYALLVPQLVEDRLHINAAWHRMSPS